MCRFGPRLPSGRVSGRHPVEGIGRPRGRVSAGLPSGSHHGPFGNIDEIGRRGWRPATAGRPAGVADAHRARHGCVMFLGACMPPWVAQPDQDQPPGQSNQPETDQAVNQDRGQRPAGPHPGSGQRQAERPLGDPEPAGGDGEALRSNPRAISQQEIVPGHRGPDGEDAHGQHPRAGQPVPHRQDDHHRPARQGKLQLTQPPGPDPDDLAGIGHRPARQPGSAPQRPHGGPLQRTPQPRPPRGHGHPDQNSRGEHTAGNGHRRG
jgi:hypothetical protein